MNNFTTKKILALRDDLVGKSKAATATADGLRDEMINRYELGFARGKAVAYAECAVILEMEILRQASGDLACSVLAVNHA